MYDLHTHSLLSDGELLPSELARRYEAKGYKAIAITDHVDASNIKIVVPAIVGFCKQWPKKRIKVVPGIELTHVPLEQFSSLIRYARRNGIKIIVAHGQTTVEPVIEGTNKKALSSDIDVLAHPGRLTREEALLAKKRGIFLEITARGGHKLTNRHVVRVARATGASVLLNSDSHCPKDILSSAQVRRSALKSGLSTKEISRIIKKTAQFVALL